jgi:hypothetical protein
MYARIILKCATVTILITASLPTSGRMFLVTNGPQAEIDTRMHDYCSTYKGFGDLFNADSTVKTPEQRMVDEQLCACNMNEALYDNFEKELVKNYPGYGNLGIVNKCMLPQCAFRYHREDVFFHNVSTSYHSITREPSTTPRLRSTIHQIVRT